MDGNEGENAVEGIEREQTRNCREIVRIGGTENNT